MKTSVLKKIAGFSVPTFISAGIGFISTPIITRIFETSEVGKINLFITYLSLISAFCYMGLDQAYIRFYNELPKNETKESLLATCMKFSLGIAFVVSCVILLGKDYVSNIISGEQNDVIAICLIVALLGSIFNRYLQSNSRMEENILMYSLQAIGYTLVIKIAYIIAAFKAPTHVNAIQIIAIGCLVLGCVFCFVENKKIRWKESIKKTTSISIWKYGFPLMPGVILVLLNNSISQIVLSTFMSYSMVGIYSSAISVANLLSLVQSGFNTYWSAYVWKNYENDQEGIQNMHHIIVFIMTLCGIGIILMQDVIFLLLGENFREGRYVFAYLLLSPICYTIAETTGLGIGISKKSYLNTIITCITLVINIITSCVLIPLIGLRGAALASGFAGGCYLMLRTVIGERFYKCITNKEKTVISLMILVLLAIFSDIFTTHIVCRILCCVVALVLLAINYHNMISSVLHKVILHFKGDNK